MQLSYCHAKKPSRIIGCIQETTDFKTLIQLGLIIVFAIDSNPGPKGVKSVLGCQGSGS